ncbi:MAG TPA: hypothetical protein GX719_13240 [Gammaproteobacteria bacterium]|nr:hypothetical protein [Gammaproteobacteria bacterium]
MLTISYAKIVLSGVTLIYIIAVGWLLLTLFAKKPDMRVPRPLLTMFQVAMISSVVFMLASVPSIVARIVNPEILPFIMPYTAILLAVSFIAFILKLDSKRGGREQAAVALFFAASISVALLVAQLILPTVFIGA